MGEKGGGLFRVWDPYLGPDGGFRVLGARGTVFSSDREAGYSDVRGIKGSELFGLWIRVRIRFRGEERF